MQISLSKFSLFLAGLSSLGLIVGTGYLFFTIFLGGPEPEVIPTLSLTTVGVFGPKYQKASAALVDPVSKISLNKDKNLQFLKSPLYESFTEEPNVISLTKIRGRADPFVPYVAP